MAKSHGAVDLEGDWRRKLASAAMLAALDGERPLQ